MFNGSRRYFFHATSERQLDSDYNAQSEDTYDDSHIRKDERAAGDDDHSQVQESTPTTMKEPEGSPVVEPDPALSEWFKVETPNRSTNKQAPPSNEEDSETEPDSDYDEIHFEGETDEWVSVDPTDKPEAPSNTSSVSASIPLLSTPDQLLRFRR